METLKIELFFDGSCDNNSKMKYMGIGVAVYCNGIFSEEWSHSEMIGTNGTNNIAEYEACKKALEILREMVKVNKDLFNIQATVYGDSQLIVNQLNGEWRVRQYHLKSYFRECNLVKIQVEDYLRGIKWIRRNKNEKADELSTREVRKFIQNIS